MTPSTLINDRYALEQPPRPGGMADVYKAYDIHDSTHVAVKLFSKGKIEDEILKEVFDRELRALKELRHPHIVELRDSGTDSASGNLFVVLEWMNSDLSSLRQTSPFHGWDSFYVEVGRPLLNALAFAHSRHVIHRDVKPKNVLLDAAGVPKLADFGVSKLKTWLEPGLTLNEFVSRPFCPPEVDDGSYTYTRDVFGFAALAVQCLWDQTLHTYEELFVALDDVDVPPDIFALLSKALSNDPKARQANATVLLSQLEAIQSPRETDWIQREDVFLELSASALEKLRKDFPAKNKDEICGIIAQDLNAVCGIVTYHSNVPNSTDQFSLYGATLSCHVAVHRANEALLVIIGAAKLSSTLLEQRREKAFIPLLNFRFGTPPKPEAAMTTLLNIREGLEKHQAELRAREAEFQEQELFRIWASVLKLKTDIERQKERPLRYCSSTVEENRVHFQLLTPPEDDVIGQQRRVDIEQHCLVSGQVEEINGKCLTLYVDRIATDDLPNNGELIIDNWAAREAINRQKAALDAVRFDRALRSDLRQLLVHPDRCKLPTDPGEMSFFDTTLDEPKQNAVAKAVSSEDFLVVQGPPGTGKTTFITEVIRQTLARNPKARILLTSQTHVALDNAVEKLKRAETPFRIVRIGRLDNPRISKEIERLLLDNQMQSWRDEVLGRGRLYLADWAHRHGISQQQFEVASLLRQLSSITVQLTELTAIEAQLEKDIVELRTTSKTAVETHEVPEGFEDIKQAEEELAGTKTQIQMCSKEKKQITAQLRKIEPDSAELLDSSPEELESWAETYVPDSPAARQFKELIKTHTAWETRFGRVSDFEPALITSSQVIAGTCVGLAAIRGLADLEFDLCIVDEASKATPTETLVPLARARRWILVGDRNQLPPFVEDSLRDNVILEANSLEPAAVMETLFSRLQEQLPASCTTALSMQHRMVPDIGRLISECFYNSQLTSAPKTWDPTFQHILPKPVVWFTTTKLLNRHETVSGVSFSNACEAQIIYQLLFRMNGIADSKRTTWKILVITGYAEQKHSLVRTLAALLPRLSGLNVECNTVDAVQGREADVAIYSVARSNPVGRLGFLREARRLNVALSRGRQYLVLVGDHHFCRTATGDNPFRRVVEYIEQNPSTCALREYKN